MKFENVEEAKQTIEEAEKYIRKNDITIELSCILELYKIAFLDCQTDQLVEMIIEYR